MNEQTNKPSVDGGLLNMQKAFKSMGKGLFKDKTIKAIDSSVSILDNVNKEMSSLNKNLLAGNKSLVGEIKKLANAYVKSQTKDDVYKSKDPNVDFLNQLLIGNSLAKENNKLQKEKNKQTSSGLLGMLGMIGKIAGGLLIGGGLIGYLMTGKTEFLNNMWKGLLKYSPVGMIIKLFDKGLNLAKKPLGKIFGKVFGNLADGMLKSGMLGKAGKKLAQSSIGKRGVARMGTRALAKIGGKGLAKIGTKVAKSVLMKIPVIGGLMGLYFGIQRFKKGDWLGGVLEVVSGISSIVPGGFVLGAAIDIFLMARDFKNMNVTEAPKEVKKKSNNKDFLRKLPVIGPIYDIMDGIKLWKTDKKKSLGLIAKGILTLNPKMWVISTVMDLISKGDNKDISGDAIDSTMGLAQGQNPTQNKQQGDRVFSMFGKAKNYSSSVYDKSNDVFTKMSDMNQGKLASASRSSNDLSGIQSIIRQNKHVNLSGIHPDVWHNFVGMAEEYYAQTGKTIQVNSGYRSSDLQRKLYEESLRNGKMGSVAAPGRSLHEFGLALDINSDSGNALDRSGLLSKWKFNRPLVNNPTYPEPWHLEPIGLDRQTKVLRSDSASASNSIGDRILESNIDANLPSSRIGSNVSRQDTPITLSEQSINMLAEKIGYQFKRNIPEMKSGVGGSPVASRR